MYSKTWKEFDIRLSFTLSMLWSHFESSLAKVGERDFARGLECVVGCLRVIAFARPRWWTLENPAGSLIARWLGPSRDTWEPYESGDAWTKRTGIWGDFRLPKRGPFVEAEGSAMDRPNFDERSITPPGFCSCLL